MASIKLKDVSISFPIYNASTRSLKNRLLPSNLGGRIGADDNDVSIVEALADIDLTLNHGDRLGLVGHNGAGKTTLLRVLAGLYEPGRGKVQIDGHVAPLFDITLGMEAESNGYDNIYLRGLFLGLTEQQIEAKMDDIAAFTELGEFLSLPIRTYSAGMRMRLAFAISTAIEPDILLLDEGIGAGDAAFVDKAEARLAAFTARAGIIVLASHSDGLIRKICRTALLMEHGRIIMHGEVGQVLDTYRKRVADAA